MTRLETFQVQIGFGPGQWDNYGGVWHDRERAEAWATEIASHLTGGRSVGFKGLMYFETPRGGRGRSFVMRIKNLTKVPVEYKRPGITRAVVASPVLRKREAA